MYKASHCIPSIYIIFANYTSIKLEKIEIAYPEIYFSKDEKLLETLCLALKERR